MDSHLIATDYAQIYIYERLQNKSFSWALISTFGQHTSAISDISWNGDDSILVGDNNSLYMYVKDEIDTWNIIPPTTESDIGITGGLGYTIISYDKDTFLASIPVAQADNMTGRVAVIKRRQNTWSVVGLISGSLKLGYFAEAIVVTNQSLLFDGPWMIQSIPRCAIDPLDYECVERVSLDSCDFGQFELSLICNTTQQDCASTDTMQIRGLVVKNNTMHVDFEIHRTTAESLVKSVTIDCFKQTDITVPASQSQPQPVTDSPLSVASPQSAPPNRQLYCSHFWSFASCSIGDHCCFCIARSKL